MKPVSPLPLLVGLGDLLLGRLGARGRAPRRRSPSPGWTRLPAISPSVSASTVAIEEVAERAQRQTTGAGHVAQRGDADHDRDEDDRRGDRLDELQERVREPLRVGRRTRGDQAEHDAGGDRHQDPEPQLPLHGSVSSRLSPTRDRVPRGGRSYGGESALSRLWSYWSQASLWSRENISAMRVRSLAGRLLILQLTVVAVTVAAGALITVLVARERTETRRARPLADRRAHDRRAARARRGDPQQRPERHAPAAGRARAQGRPRRLHHDHAPRRHPLHAPERRA